MIRYSYEFERIKTKGKMTQTRIEDDAHREIVHKYSQLGYRLAHIIPIVVTANGAPVEYELIFERQSGA